MTRRTGRFNQNGASDLDLKQEREKKSENDYFVFLLYHSGNIS